MKKSTLDIRKGETINGDVATYCTICRDVCEHALATGRTKVSQYTLVVCRQCSLRSTVNAAAFQSFHRGPIASVIDLMQATYPLLPRDIIERAHYDHMLIAGAVPPEIRAQALREPFMSASYLLAPLVQRRDPNNLSGMSVVLILFGIGSFVTIRLMWEAKVQTSTTLLTTAILGAITLVLVTIAVRTRLRKNRRTLDTALALIARGLRPLRPTELELEQALIMLRVANITPKSLTAGMVGERVAKLPDSSFSNVMFDDLRARAAEQFETQRRLAHEAEGTGDDPLAES